MERQTVRFIITVYGNKYIGLLITNIYSILQSNPKSHISIFWQDVEEPLMKAVMKTFNTATYHKTNFDFDSDPIKRISSKVYFWNCAAKNYPHQNLCFLDVDTLVIKNVQHFFNQDFDITYTYKHDQFPLNTGVILCKGEKYPLFFKLWKNKTVKIINDAELFSKANSPKYPYGGSDQMSLFQLLDYNPNKKDYRVPVFRDELVFRGKSCNDLNEVYSKSINENTHIIHYKGWWHKILLEGQNFQKKVRTKKLSWEMYILFLKIFMKSLELIGAEHKTNFKPKDFNIVFPFYVNKLKFKENKVLYHFYYYHILMKNYSKKYEVIKILLVYLKLLQNRLAQFINTKIPYLKKK
jgi:hypothetical protein